jgi:hypothetical protein
MMYSNRNNWNVYGLGAYEETITKESKRHAEEEERKNLLEDIAWSIKDKSCDKHCSWCRHGEEEREEDNIHWYCGLSNFVHSYGGVEVLKQIYEEKYGKGSLSLNLMEVLL